MPIIPLRYIKNWFLNTSTSESNWDSIADPTSEWALRVDNNLKQVGLDLDGADYDFNNVGRSTQSSSVVARLDLLELAQAGVGHRNLGLDVSTASSITLTASNGAALSATNLGQAAFNSEASAGESVVRNITANITLSLAGAHWGLGTLGDFTDVILWVYLIDDGGTVRLGVSKRGGKDFVASADSSTVQTAASTEQKVLVDTTLAGGDSSTITLGWLKANFDDTGNAEGEDFWAVQTGLGDINLERTLNRVEAVIEF